MEKFINVTDSCSDLDKSAREKYQIEYLPMHFSENGKDYDADLDWKEISFSDYYNKMRNGTRFITAQVNVAQYREAFEKYAKEGYGILSISCSSKLSASVRASEQAREEVLNSYPDAKIYCIDSLISCAGLGMICINASKLRSEGKSLEETVAWVEENKLNFHQEATVEKLTWLKQAGRVSAASAFFGGLLNVKPIIISDAIGQNFAVEKVKGRKVSFTRLVERVKEAYDGTKYPEIVVAHGDVEEEAKAIKEMLVSALGVDESLVQIDRIGPIIGASTGPGVIGIYYYGSKVTENAEA